MKIIFVVISFFLLSNSHFAEAGFCQRTQTQIHEALSAVEHRLSFKNRGGLINGGVCWWHSRLQRSSLYLARFAPHRPKPNPSQVRGILSALKNMNQVVLIGGYENFLAFSQDHENAIQAMLELWQKEDGIINFQWIRGISGRSELPSPELEIKMRKLHETFLKSPTPVWVMAQMKGITSHAYLIRDMEVLPSGYVLEVIDSNAPDILRYARYQFGDKSLRVEGGKNSFVPYVGFQEDFVRIKKAIESFCRWNPHALAGPQLFGKEIIEMGEIEPNL